jgi:hypothetical protein
MIHFGQSFYGKVDVVPKLCHVATRFLHINFVPLIPLGSYIIVTGGSKTGSNAGTETSLSVKSILMAWFRAGLIGAAIFSGFVGTFATEFGGRKGQAEFSLAAVWGVVGGLCLTLWLTYRFNRAGYDRAHQLGAELGLPSEVVEGLLTYGNASPVPPPAPGAEPEGWERYS